MTETERTYDIAVFGLGYVGCVSAACLARDGHRVVGIDVSEVKRRQLAEGRAPVEEPGLAPLIRDAVAAGRLRVAESAASAVREADLSLVCVGTPSSPSGGIDLGYVERVCREIGAALADRAPGHVVALRSTVMPGTLDGVAIPALEEASGRKEGVHFHAAFNPEFLREGTALSDYDKPPKVVVGTRSLEAAEAVSSIYGHLPAPLFVVEPRVAEMVKYADNAWHAVKITFGNEVGALCRCAGVDSHAVIDVFLADRHLNISPVYLRPGFAFGGSCLPKDLRAILHYARHHDVDVPMLSSVLPSNRHQVERVFARIVSAGCRRVGLYGLSFKPDTDDLRESPFVTLAEQLIGKGFALRVYDENIQPDRLLGANREYVERHLPHFVDLLVPSFGALEAASDLIVVGHRTAAAAEWVRARDPRIRVIDLCRLPGMADIPNYEGISW